MKNISVKLAEHFNKKPEEFSFQKGKGWFWKDHYLHKSFHEIQNCPGWALKDVTAFDFNRRLS